MSSQLSKELKYPLFFANQIAVVSGMYTDENPKDEGIRPLVKLVEEYGKGKALFSILQGADGGNILPPLEQEIEIVVQGKRLWAFKCRIYSWLLDETGSSAIAINS